MLRIEPVVTYVEHGRLNQVLGDHLPIAVGDGIGVGAVAAGCRCVSVPRVRHSNVDGGGRHGEEERRQGVLAGGCGSAQGGAGLLDHRSRQSL